MTRKKFKHSLSNIVELFILLPLMGLIACNQPIPENNAGISITSVLQAPATPTVTPSIQIPATPSITTTEKDFGLKFNPWELVHDLAFSPDGKLLAVATGDQVYIYDAATLEMKFDLSPGAWANCLAFHPTASLIALAVRDGSVQIWEMGKGTKICQFTAHIKGTNSLAFHPDGTMLATTGTDITSRLWNISSVIAGSCNVSEIGRLIGESYSSPEVMFSPDGKLIALVDRTKVRLRNNANRKLIALLSGDLPIFDISFSPDGRWLAVAEHQDTVAIWDISQPSKPVFFDLAPVGSNPKIHIWRVTFSSDSRLMAAGASDGSINVWDIHTLQLIRTYQLPQAVTALAFSPDGIQLAAGGLDAQVWFFSFP